MFDDEVAVRKKVGRPRKYQSDAERKLSYHKKKMEHQAQIKVFVDHLVKDRLKTLCNEHGLTQSELLSQLILSAGRN